jgi:glycosyltransferase involved in cell wall biosynthesis
METEVNIIKPNVLFLYDIANETHWKDGLSAALQLLEKDFDIRYWNLALEKTLNLPLDAFDFILGWSSFDGEISHLMRKLKQPHGLCIGGYMFEPHNINHFNVLFYETEWYADAELKHRHPNCVHAFGVNTNIFKPLQSNSDEKYVGGAYPKVFDYLTIGAFAKWKRQVYVLKKEGNRLAIGQIQDNNMDESFDIISQLLAYGVAVQGEVSPETLAQYINAAKCVYLPATITGGSERSVLEARACGVPVEIEDDNPKLQELLTSPVWDHHYYYQQLKKGIESCLIS